MLDLPRFFHTLFESEADQNPNAPALIRGDEVVTYGDLEKDSNRLAWRLRELGAAPGKFVALHIDRSQEAITAILACLKSGATYIPLDPALPQDRIQHILEETNPVAMLNAATWNETIGDLSSYPERRPLPSETGASDSDVAYVIYTSGTTGRPKGVMAEHRNVLLYARAFNEVCGTQASDRIYQGFSLGFDGSIEEIWMAFSNGSALVLPEKDTAKFGNELARYLDRQGVTYFSTVPTLLSTMTEGIPSLRTLVVSGEVCPPELVARWAREGLRMLNVYGPTEATVNTTAFECAPGKKVTIGKPLAGYEIHILNERLEEVSRGEKGELFVGGLTLARGYFKRPELTAEKFLVGVGPKRGTTERLYRTGDLVRWSETDELEFFGRIDSQVKIRGYRVELAEIESVLLEHPQIATASLRLVQSEGIQDLAAYVMLEGDSQLDRDGVLALLKSKLPPYMIPGTLDVLAEFPMLTSGKVDRNLLPPPICPLVRTARKITPPSSPLEAEIAQAWAKVFGVPEVSVEDDFFLDLGGHSLIAAQMVTALRQQTGRLVTVRDAYRFPSVQKLASHLATAGEVRGETRGASRPRGSARAAFESVSAWVRTSTVMLQGLSTYFSGLTFGIPFVLVFLYGIRWFHNEVSLVRFIAYGIVIGLMTWPILIAVGLSAKWILIGKYRAGSYPLWGSYYLRWWLVGKFSGLSGVGAFVGTPILPLYYRLMGAKVGKNCVLDSALCSSWDLVEIGEGTSIGADTQVLGYKIEDGMLILGNIRIGKRCFLGNHSSLGIDVSMGDDSRLDDQSLLPDGEGIPAGESRRGSPAQPAPVIVPAGTGVPWKRPILFGLIHFLLTEALATVGSFAGIPFIACWKLAFSVGIKAQFLYLILVVPYGFMTTALWIVVLKWLILPKAQAGTFPIESFFYVRKWLSDGLMKASRALLLPLYTTMYFPTWLRMLGAKIGPRAELSTVWNFAPELVDVGAESFFADGSIIGGKRHFGGSFQISRNRIGRRSFVGNSAILPVGSSLGDGCLLGVQSIPPAEPKQTPDGTEWLGSPSFSLPHRPKVGNFDSSVTFNPTLRLYIERGLIDGLRILIPGYIGLVSLILGVWGLYSVWAKWGIFWVYALSPALGIALGLMAIFSVVILKWVVMGKFKPVIKPLWSRYVWLNEMVNGAYESVMAPSLAAYLGTPVAPFFLRLLGCKIGKRTMLLTTLFSEWDLVEIGDYAALGSGAVIQNHLFEDRVMKSSSLSIGDECSVGSMAVVLYDSRMLPGASLNSLSLLMKGETLSPEGRWVGIPTSQVGTEAPSGRLEQASLEFHGARPGLKRGSRAMPEVVAQPG